MPVYVDDMMPVVSRANWPWREACHMYADSVNELLSFAVRIGLKPERLQQDDFLPHFDLVRAKRRRAIRAGAIPVARRHVARRLRSARFAHWRAELNHHTENCPRCPYIPIDGPEEMCQEGQRLDRIWRAAQAALAGSPR
jgi:hypothetical protein